MAKYRPKGDLIEAVKWDPKWKPPDVPKWLFDLLCKSENPMSKNGRLKFYCGGWRHDANPGDYIIRTPDDLAYVMDARQFEARYEPAEEAKEPTP